MTHPAPVIQLRSPLTNATRTRHNHDNRTPSSHASAVLLGGLLTAVFIPLGATNSADLKPTAYAIRDALSWSRPEPFCRRPPSSIRDGLITAVGPDAEIPADAAGHRRKGADRLPRVHRRGKFSRVRPRPSPIARRPAGGVEDTAADPLAATKPDNRKGVTPEFAVHTALKLDEEAVAAWRKVGFTAHLVTPDGGYFFRNERARQSGGACARRHARPWSRFTRGSVG